MMDSTKDLKKKNMKRDTEIHDRMGLSPRFSNQQSHEVQFKMKRNKIMFLMNFLNMNTNT